MNATQVDAALRRSGIIAIVRGNFPHETLLRIGEALRKGGVAAVEVTLNSAGALAGIEALRRHFGEELLVGAGTVRTVADVDAALSAGAAFLVSPNFDPESVARSRQVGVVHLPGVFTASEAQAAHAAGCRLVKLFPADALGPVYLRALRAPLDDVGFVPTGGIDATNLAEYVRAGAAAFGVGGALVRKDEDDIEALATRARALVGALRRAREAYGS
ncbi:MAG TPA: bifunctional 4-hydroxy-2-oxoglutarate aldolase/2-dehydro-3-deoxy-phosphogluconate aldolase [Longimicrobiaceae bacterium]